MLGTPPYCRLPYPSRYTLRLGIVSLDVDLVIGRGVVSVGVSCIPDKLGKPKS